LLRAARNKWSHIDGQYLELPIFALFDQYRFASAETAIVRALQRLQATG
jgi:hypothetical protein